MPDHAPGRPSAASRPRFPLGLLGMAATVVAIESWVDRSERAMFVNDVAESWLYSARAATREAVGAEYLFFGDSMVKFGVAPRVFEARTGRPGHNLASYGGPPSSSYFLLRRAIDAGARPRAVVVDFAPNLLALDGRFHRRQWQAIADPAEAIDLAIQDRDPTLLAAILVGRALPSARDRLEIRKNLLMALAGKKSYSYLVHQFYHPWVRNWHVNLGGETRVRVPAFRDGVDRSDVALFPADWAPDPSARRYVERFLDLAESRRIAVYWLIPPIHPASQAVRDSLGLEAAYSAIVREIRARHPSLVVVDGRASHYAPEVFYDPVHLVAPGSSALTTALADILLDPRRPAGGWLQLPRYREQAPIVALEDEDQSREAMRARPR